MNALVVVNLDTGDFAEVVLDDEEPTGHRHGRSIEPVPTTNYVWVLVRGPSGLENKTISVIEMNVEDVASLKVIRTIRGVEATKMKINGARRWPRLLQTCRGGMRYLASVVISMSTAVRTTIFTLLPWLLWLLLTLL